MLSKIYEHIIPIGIIWCCMIGFMTYSTYRTVKDIRKLLDGVIRAEGCEVELN